MLTTGWGFCLAGTARDDREDPALPVPLYYFKSLLLLSIATS